MNRNSDDVVEAARRWPFKRIVILTSSGTSWLGAACAISWVNSPFFSQKTFGNIRHITFADHFGPSQVVLSAQDCASLGIRPKAPLSEFESLSRDVAAGASLMSRVTFAVDVAHKTGAVPFVPDPERDLYVYVSAWSDAECCEHVALHSLRVIKGGGHLVLLADHSTQQSVWSLAQQLSGWKVLSCCVSCYSPPCHDLQLAGSLLRHCSEMKGVLECVCLGVALGTVKHLPLGFRDPVCVTPLDVATDTVLVFAALQHAGHPLLSSAGGAIIDVAPTGDDGLVWGMFAEYLMDYYARFGPMIAKSSPHPYLLDPKPTLHLSPSVADVVNYGASLLLPLPCYYMHAATQRRKQLIKNLSKSVAPKDICAVLECIDAAILRISVRSNFGTSQCGPRNTPGSSCLSASSGSECYKACLETLAQDSSLWPLRSFVTSRRIKWDLYVKTLAQAVVGRIALQFSGRIVNLPSLSPLYQNDIVFRGPRRVPATILWPRRLCSDLHWTLRSGLKSNGARAVTVPGLTKESQKRILDSPTIVHAIEEVAKSEKSSSDVVRARAVSILRTVGDTLNQVQLRVFGLIIRRVLFHLYDEVTLNDEAFERLHTALNTPRSHTVLIPAHRSYVDFLIMTYLLVVMSLPPPHICAGEDFLRMGPISNLMRGSGAFFMRRSFRGDRLYQTVFKEYVSHIVLQRKVMQFFIEGQRSRTGKTQRPRLGILKFVLDTFFSAQSDVDDIYIVPISLSYDELLEAKLYADEQFGVLKPRETVSNLLRARSLLNARHGSIHINVGEVISLRQFRDNPHQCPKPFLPVGGYNVVPQPNTNHHVTPPVVLSNLAWHITHCIQQNTVITPTALLAGVLGAFAPTGTGMGLQEVHYHMMWLRTLVSTRQGPLSLDCAGSDPEALCHKALSHLTHFVEVSSGSEVRVCIRQDISSFTSINICSNQLVHLFVDEAICAVVTRTYGEFDPEKKTLSVQTCHLKEGCEKLRGMLSAEFQDYLSSCPYTLTSWLESAISRIHKYDDVLDDSHAAETNVSLSLTALPIEEAKEEEKLGGTMVVDTIQDISSSNRKSAEDNSVSQKVVVIRLSRLFRFLIGILSPFIESLYLASLGVRALVGSGGERVLLRKPFLKVCQKCGLEMYARRHFILHPQSCSTNSLQNAIDGVASFCGLESSFDGNDLTYKPRVVASSPSLQTQVQMTLRDIRNFLFSVMGVQESDKEEQKAHDTILNAYREQLVLSRPASKI